MSQLFLSALPIHTQPAPTAKRFGLSAAELRAKRAAAKARCAEQERIVELEALVQRVEDQLKRSRWNSFHRQAFIMFVEMTNNAVFLRSDLFDERFDRQYIVERECLRIRESYRPLIEAARLDIAGSAARRRAKRDAKESRRQQRRSAQAT